MLFKIENQKGMTLLELLVAIAITGMLALVIVQVFTTQNKLFAGERYISRNISHARIVIDTLARHIRKIGYDPAEADGDIFGLKDNTGNFTTNAITSNTSLYFTKDDDEDGLLDTNVNEEVAISYNSATNTLQLGGITGGSVSSWINRWPNVTAFTLSYIYSDGTSSSGSTSLPDNSVSNHTFNLVTAIVVSITTRTEEMHNLMGKYIEESIESTILLRNKG